MIKLKTILSELLLSEALPLSVAKEYTSIKRNPSIQQRLDSIFTELAKLEGASTSKRGDRVYFPFSTSGGMVTHESPVKKEVEAALQGTDFKLKDYKLGVAVDKYGRETKLGKALSKIGKPDLVNKFNGDKTRESAKKTDFIIVFSKHPYDIAGMSTDRGWTSCMSLYIGGFKKHIKWDVKQGSFVCYLTRVGDTNLSKPTGRIAVKPYVNVENKKDVLYSPEQTIYGTAPNEFLNTVNDILSKIQGEKVGKFELSQELYCDTVHELVKYPKEIQDILDGKSNPENKSDVEQILSILEVENYKINDDLSVDVNGSVDISGVEKLKLRLIPIQFGKVSGYFFCKKNELITLEGSPKEVGGVFNCGDNQLTSLEGAPKKVGGGFICSRNRLTSLEGSPEKVGGSFLCDFNQLTSLEGAPKEIDGDFYCNSNQLTSLEGVPKEIDGAFYCNSNKLTSLEGAPEKVGDYFDCSNNNLKSLRGAPQKVGEYFICRMNFRLPQSEKDWAEKNIKAEKFSWER
jgi:hypothetical protein